MFTPSMIWINRQPIISASGHGLAFVLGVRMNVMTGFTNAFQIVMIEC